MISKRQFVIGAAGLGTLSTFGITLAPGQKLKVAAQTLLPNQQSVKFTKKPFAPVSTWAGELIAAAENQVGTTIYYDGAYKRLSYPMGDIPRQIGVCTDVVVRAYRDAFKIDLQKLVHEDMKSNFHAYPKIWRLKRPDKNIDHRRVPNLERYFKRKGAALALSKDARDYQPGDLISSRLPGNLPHIAIVTQRPSRDGERPLIVHNIGAGTRIEDGLFDYRIVGHFRFKPQLA